MSTKSNSRSSSGAKLRRRKRPGYLKYVKWGLVLGLFTGLVFGIQLSWKFFKRCSFLKIAQIEVIGNHHASTSEILILSGIEPGMGIFDFKLSQVVEGIQTHPWVKKVRVSRQLPDRVRILIEERKPEAILIWGQAYYLDAEGSVFKRLIPGDDLNYPIITGLTLDDLQKKNPRKFTLLKAAFRLWEMAGDSKIFPREQISELHLETASGLNLFTREGQRIILGDGDLEEKFHTLELIRVETGEDFYLIQKLDLSRLDRVVARFLHSGPNRSSSGTEPEVLPGGPEPNTETMIQ